MAYGGYNYSQLKSALFTEEKQKLFLAIRDQVHYMLSISGAITMESASNLPENIGSASNWEMMACVDRLVELGELKEIHTTGIHNDRIFVKGK